MDTIVKVPHRTIAKDFKSITVGITVIYILAASSDDFNRDAYILSSSGNIHI